MWWSEARVVALGLVAVLAAGCGFHLQSALALPEGVQSVHVAARDELTPFAVELRRALERSGARVAPSSAGADAVIRVRQDRTGRRVLSVSARNTPQEFEVYYSVEFAIDRGGQEALAPRTLDATRYFSFDESLLLAKDREESSLREAMARDLADLVLRQLGSL
jgi:LPS-assembly lipoprotein